MPRFPQSRHPDNRMVQPLRRPLYYGTLVKEHPIAPFAPLRSLREPTYCVAPLMTEDVKNPDNQRDKSEKLVNILGFIVEM